MLAASVLVSSGDALNARYILDMSVSNLVKWVFILLKYIETAVSSFTHVSRVNSNAYFIVSYVLTPNV